MKADEFIQDALHVLEARGKQRDSANKEERSMGTAVDIFNAVTQGRYAMPEEDGWLFMVCLKLGRDANQKEYKGVKYNRDDIVDLVGYSALYGECKSEKLQKLSKD